MMYRTMEVDDTVVVIAHERADLEEALRQVSAAGLRVLSEIHPMGREFAFTCQKEDCREDEVSVTKMGMRVMIKGPTEHSVSRKLSEFVRAGSRLVSAPTLLEGVWLAICDDINQVRYW